MSVVVAIIAPGEMGSGIGRRLREGGARVLTSLKGRSARSAARAAEAGLEVVSDDDDLVREAGFVLSIVPPAKAQPMARRLAPALTRAGTKPVFVDCNAVAPRTVARIAAIVGESGCPFVDAGIIGGPPAPGAVDPRFYVSGDAAEALQGLVPYGLSVRVMKGPVGTASAFKMCYAGLTKGLTAIGAGMMLASARGGVAGELLSELAESQPHLLAWLRRQVPHMFPKAYRWVAEMEEIAQFVDGDAGTQQIFAGAAQLYERLAAADPTTASGELEVLTRLCR